MEREDLIELTKPLRRNKASDVQIALDLSKEHWADLAQKGSFNFVDAQEDSCALCHLFVKRSISMAESMKTCGGCPIEVYVGHRGCYHTPFEAVFSRLCDNDFKADANDLLMKALVNKQLDFIASVNRWFQGVKHLWA